MALAIWTALAMLAFAGNSILTRMAVGAGAIDAQSFALIRLVSGAFMLALVMLWRKRQWPALRGRGPAVLGLLVYLFGFSAAYVSGLAALMLERNPRLDAELFRFTVPRGADVVEQ